ncbi:MAG: hypothetical protein L3K17_07075 [Thermoplasmata archaeon]|nr:hypothetical protein [Thermoplasmata archaeon]
MIDPQTLGEVGAVVEVAIAIMLVVGMWVVRRGHIRAHMYIQSSMVLVNIPFVLLTMVPYYLAYVLPGLPGEISEPFYLYPTIMLVAGLSAEALGVYIVLVAATNWIPERFRFRRFKLWMRTELTLWWVVVFVGLTTYVVWWG